MNEPRTNERATNTEEPQSPGPSTRVTPAQRLSRGLARGGRRRWLLLPVAAASVIVALLILNAAPGAQQEFASTSASGTLNARLLPTAHPSVPATLQTMWYARSTNAAPTSGPLANLANGVRMLDKSEDPAAALALVSNGELANTDVANYARYYTGVALQRLNRLDEAESQFAAIDAAEPLGYLSEAPGYRRAEIREAKGDFAGAVVIYEELLKRGVASPSIALVKLGAAASAAGDRQRAIEAHRRVLREFPLAAEAAEAEQLLDRLGGFVFETSDAVREELNRAESLFKARQWSQARSSYERIQGRLTDVDRDRATLRLAQIDATNGRHRQAREVFRRYLSHETLGPEAQFANLFATRALGEDDEFKQLVEDAVARHPKNPLAEEALNELARYYVLKDDDGKAAEVYARLVEKFPSGAFAERAAWKAGWWAYRHDNFRETIRLFEHGAAAFPRSDFRPSWLYWSARAYDALGERSAATDRFRLAATDYLNTYYGRLSWRRLQERNEASVTPGVRRAIVQPPPAPPNVELISRLIELELYRPALNELQHAAKLYGDSAPLQATTALVQHKLGNLRPAITAMKRAYPQYMTAGGETLPIEIHRVLFPLDYWPLLQEFTSKHNLDPYVIAALVGQESTFDAAIRSPANAIGLMQVMPATGRQFARKLGIRPFNEMRLTEPRVNVMIGTQYFRDLLDRFNGNVHYVIASYNAGEHRVDRWRAERGELPQDEFIDDIPYPETQNYVKRILGTAEDYRRLYGPNGVEPTPVVRPAAATVVKRIAPAPTKKSTVTKRTPTKKSTVTKRTPTKRSTVRKSTDTPKRSTVKKSTNTTKRTPAKRTPTKRTTKKR